jgi:hypothetical protein
MHVDAQALKTNFTSINNFDIIIITLIFYDIFSTLFPNNSGNISPKFLPRSQLISPGTDVMIFLLFSPKNLAKKLAFLTQNKAKF